MISIERSRVDRRWCVSTRYRETLCPVWFVPLACVCMVAFYLSDRRNARRYLTWPSSADEKRRSEDYWLWRRSARYRSGAE